MCVSTPPPSAAGRPWPTSTGSTACERRKDSRQEDVEKPFDSSTRRVTYPESYITEYAPYTKKNSSNGSSSGDVRVNLTCRLISLVGVKWSCLRINTQAFPPFSLSPRLPRTAPLSLCRIACPHLGCPPSLCLSLFSRTNSARLGSFHSKVDGFVPRSQRVKLRIVGQAGYRGT